MKYEIREGDRTVVVAYDEEIVIKTLKALNDVFPERKYYIVVKED